MWHDSKFKFMNFKKVQKYIHNGFWIVQKNVISLMVKTVFESILRWGIITKKRKKLNWMCACQPMSACVRLRQRVSGGTASSRKGFCASTNWFWFTQPLVFIHRHDKKKFVRSLTRVFIRPICWVWRGPLTRVHQHLDGWAGCGGWGLFCNHFELQ
jgi:hypothetical protein